MVFSCAMKGRFQGCQAGVRVGLGFLLSGWLMGDSMMADTFIVTNTGDSGSGSLRQAILDANAGSGTNTISFQIPGTGPFNISPLSSYPPISPNPVVIDGTTQTGYAGTPLVQINGSSLGTGNDGLQLLAGNCTVSGLAIFSCKRDGIRIQGGGTNIIQGNYLGTDATGTNRLGNTEGGVYVYQSNGNLIGGTNAAERNVISGNANGIYIDDGSLPALGIGNVVQGNFIGVTAAGTKALGNVNNGVYILTAPGNVIGGTLPGAGNLISGNGISGIYLYNAGTTGNVIQGNLIGTDVTGTVAVSNRLDGVTINNAAGNTVGGTDPGAQNVISGNVDRGLLILNSGASNNLVQGNFIGTDVTGRLALGNHTNGVAISGAAGNLVGGTVPAARNIISGNQGSGVLLIVAGASNNSVAGNYIGVDVTGTNALANSFSGVTVDGVAGNTLGGSAAGAGNVISGNRQNGIYLVDAGGGTNVVQGNFIGTDFSGTRTLANAAAGVRIEVPGNLVGGTTAAARNIISGNGQSGVYLYNPGASNNLVQGNFIGTDFTGSTGLGNGMVGPYSGVVISNSPANTISAGNIISANGDKGITLNGAGATGNLIQGNYIGTDVTGNNALGNPNGGVYLYNAPGNTLGGGTSGSGNLISANNADGIYLSAANGNIIQGNIIGTKADGVSALGNLWHNIEFTANASGNLVGGSTPAADNHIAFARTAGYDGIRVRDGCIGNFISRNSIFSNGNNSVNGLGIDTGADGATTTGLPLLTLAVSGGSATAVSGTLNNTASHSFLLQFYANLVTNISGYGEGMAWLGATNITTDASGKASFTANLAAAVAPGRFIAATVTDSTNNTSEFSADVMVQSPPALNVIWTNNGGSQPMAGGLSWSSVPAGFSLVQATNLTTPVVWLPATNQVTSSGGTNTISFGTMIGNLFYRLVFQ
jgi:titin